MIGLGSDKKQPHFFRCKVTITFCLEQLVASTNPEALKKVIVVKLIKKQVEAPLSLE